jgi:hypothetical protein
MVELDEVEFLQQSKRIQPVLPVTITISLDSVSLYKSYT